LESCRPTRRGVSVSRRRRGMQLSSTRPSGRVNRPSGSPCANVLRYVRFRASGCASDNAVILSLARSTVPALVECGSCTPTPSRPRSNKRAGVADVRLAWRWTEPLTGILRSGRQEKSLPIQRMERTTSCGDIPSLAACQETRPRPIELPDHVIVAKCSTIAHEAMDVDGLKDLVARCTRRRQSISWTREPSVLSHEIVNGNRTRTSTTPRWRRGAPARCNCAGPALRRGSVAP